jgi:SNF2 family DNA or RNA helicase
VKLLRAFEGREVGCDLQKNPKSPLTCFASCGKVDSSSLLREQYQPQTPNGGGEGRETGRVRLDYPSRGWAELSWSDDDDELSREATLLISDLSDVPGVELREEETRACLAAPRNAWSLEAWQQLVRSVRVTGSVRFHLFNPGRAFVAARPLYEHQRLAAGFLVQNGGGLCADTMGLGKTAAAIDAAETLALQNGLDRHRIVIGPKYTRDVWRRELLAVGAIESEAEFFFAEGHDPRKKPIDWDAAVWFFVHYDIAHHWTTFLQRGPNGPPIVVILDECHWIKGGRNQRSRAAQAIAGCAPFRIGLTGTPMANRPSELWWPLTVLDGKRSWGSPVDFRRRYSSAQYQEQFGGYQDGEPSHIEEFQTRLKTRYIRRTIEDAGVKLPKLTRQLMNVELDDKRRETYDGIVQGVGKDNLVRAVLERRAGKGTLSAITKLRKLTSRGKLGATTAYVYDTVRAGDSVVVFVWERATVEQLARSGPYEHDHVFTVHGGYSQDARDASVREFQKYGGVLISTLDALKEGVTLTKARHVLLHDLSWVPSDILQAEARVYRIGQDKPVQSTWMVCPDSIDVLFAATLAGKADAISEMMGITAAQDAAEELGLEEFTAASSVEADIERLLGWWS